ncbi:MAG: 7-cyano-7-deazaguanine synthase [Thermoguttaceae bacterium]
MSPPNVSASDRSTIAVLASGGLDSCVLMGCLLRQGHAVQPLYVQCGLVWESEEVTALRAFLAAIATPKLAELIVFELPLADLYGSHWSLSGRGSPDAQSPDEAVYLPGRNALLTIKPAIWCAMHGIERLALALLAGNPFADATNEFLAGFESTLGRAMGSPLSILRPFATLKKEEVIHLGRDLPLELSFSCIAPAHGLPCGDCNKCHERQTAFHRAGVEDPTHYAKTPLASPF